MNLHPQSRSIFFNLPLLGVLKKHLYETDINVDLSNNTNPFLGSMANYPDLRQDQLKEQYWHLISSFSGISSPQQDMNSHILFTVGSSEGIDLLLRAFAEPNQDTIAVTDPSFPAYEHWGRLHNLNVKKVKLKGENYEQVNVQEIIASHPKLVFLCYPNNPTGTLLNPQVIYDLCYHLKEGFIVVDEAYIEFAGVPSLISDLSQFKNLIVLRTLSKAWGLAAVRCGAVIASDPRVINTLRCIQIPFGFPVPSQEIVLERCTKPQEMMVSWQKIEQERERMIKALRSSKKVKKICDSRANFFLLELVDFPQTWEMLTHHKIYVMDCSQAIDNSIRVTVGNESQNQKFLEVMGVFL